MQAIFLDSRGPDAGRADPRLSATPVRARWERRPIPRASRSAWTTRAAATRSGSRVTVPATQSMYDGSKAAICPEGVPVELAELDDVLERLECEVVVGAGSCAGGRARAGRSVSTRVAAPRAPARRAVAAGRSASSREADRCLAWLARQWRRLVCGGRVRCALLNDPVGDGPGPSGWRMAGPTAAPWEPSKSAGSPSRTRRSAAPRGSAPHTHR